jgi:hypothetical protein
MKHPYVREFEAWSTPGQLLDPDFGKVVLQHELWNEGIPRTVFIGTSNIPDPIDCKNLRLSIQSGELSESNFKEFCAAHGLPVDLNSEESACKFLEYIHGKCIAWIHLPDDADETLLPTIVKLLKDRGHVVVDPHDMTPIVLNEMGPGANGTTFGKKGSGSDIQKPIPSLLQNMQQQVKD